VTARRQLVHASWATPSLHLTVCALLPDRSGRAFAGPTGSPAVSQMSAVANRVLARLRVAYVPGDAGCCVVASLA
jgi:hypothetical protein